MSTTRETASPLRLLASSVLVCTGAAAACGLLLALVVALDSSFDLGPGGLAVVLLFLGGYAGLGGAVLGLLVGCCLAAIGLASRDDAG